MRLPASPRTGLETVCKSSEWRKAVERLLGQKWATGGGAGTPPRRHLLGDLAGGGLASRCLSALLAQP